MSETSERTREDKSPCETPNGERRSPVIRIPLPWGAEPLEVRGLSLIATLQLVLTCVVAWVLYDHHTSTRLCGDLIRFYQSQHGATK